MLGVEREPEKTLFAAERHPIPDVEHDHSVSAVSKSPDSARLIDNVVSAAR